ncbi:MAG TPA: RES family NAD+ phosphorylase [Steroidobacteraceae bacterium]|nr:RES family NAD+ phosphorylase [Steroidobacteraceae bacterium]
MAGTDYTALCGRIVAWRDDVVRNIKSIRRSQDLFDDLADSEAAREVARAAEARGRVASSSPFITRPFDYGAVITWSFDTATWQQSRFSDGTRYGVWYGARDLKTTVYETVFHWHRFLLDSFAGESRAIVGERRAFDVHCDALLVDLRAASEAEPQLLSRTSYAFTQGLGRFLVERGQSGLLMRSARCAGECAAIFDPARLSHVRDRAFLTYHCNPVRDMVRVERSPGRTWLTIRPGELA